MIDSHAHLTDKAFDGDAGVLARAKEAGVNTVVTLGWNIDSSEKSRDYAEKNEGVLCSCGVHPSDCKEFDNGVIARLFETFKSKKCIALGEIGLDYHYDTNDYDLQKQVFMRQIEIAHEAALPFIVHSRDASKDVTDIITESDKRGLLKKGFLMHCYSESKESAAVYLKHGAYFAFGGAITFRNAKKEDIIRSIPIERVLCETDCPYMAPVPLRGTVNEPKNVRFVYEKLADIYGVELGRFKEIVRGNFYRLFGAI